MSMLKKYGDADWWFGDNSFWAKLNVSNIDFKGFGISFHDRKNIGNLANLLPIFLLGLVAWQLTKK